MSDLVVVLFDRPNVDAMKVQEPLAALAHMIETPQSAREYAGKVTIAFEGFEDETELHFIPSVQRFVRELTERFPYWLHFANKDDDTLFVLMACLVPPEPLPEHERQPRPGKVQMAFDGEKWNAELLRLFGFMNGLYERLGFTAEENSAMTQAVAAWNRRVMGGAASRRN